MDATTRGTGALGIPAPLKPSPQAAAATPQPPAPAQAVPAQPATTDSAAAVRTDLAARSPVGDPVQTPFPNPEAADQEVAEDEGDWGFSLYANRDDNERRAAATPTGPGAASETETTNLGVSLTYRRDPRAASVDEETGERIDRRMGIDAQGYARRRETEASDGSQNRDTTVGGQISLGSSGDQMERAARLARGDR